MARNHGVRSRFPRRGASPGSVLDQWRPTGTETDFSLSPILSPLEALKQRILVLDDLDMKSAIGEQGQAGMVALLTGTSQITAGLLRQDPQSTR